MQQPRFQNRFRINDTEVTLRPIQPEDRDIEQAFVRQLSRQSRYYRFHGPQRELTPEMLDRFTNVDYPREAAVIATIQDERDEVQIGVARYAQLESGDGAEVAVVVADEWQRRGVATRLLMTIREVAVAAGISRLHAIVMSENREMYSLAKKLGFVPVRRESDFTVVSLGKQVNRQKV